MATWLDSLQSYVATHKRVEETKAGGATAKDLDREVCRVLEEREGKLAARDAAEARIGSAGGPRRSSGAGAGAGAGAGGGAEIAGKGATRLAIPRFYFKPAEDTLAKTFDSAAHQRALRRKINDLLSSEDLSTLASLLETHATPPDDGVEARINYDGFCIVRDGLPAKADEFFKPSIFMRLKPDRLDRISTKAFYSYVMFKVSMMQTRIQLALQDTEGRGVLKETDLENFVFNLIPELPPLRTLQESFYPFYVFHAVRKFMFFLPNKNGRVTIKSIVGSKVLAEFLQLKNPRWSEADNRRNWFSGAKALGIYSQYLELDTNHNGMLSKSELAKFGNGSMTNITVTRVFQEFHTYGGEMDYKTFLDFVLAMEYKKSQQSIAYFFRVLDVNHRGFLTRFNINVFFREILARMRGQEAIAVGDVCVREQALCRLGLTRGVGGDQDEIFDMVKPADGLHIYLKDLYAARVGHTVVHMLIDVNGFWMYDNRESLMHEDDPEDDDPGDEGY